MASATGDSCRPALSIGRTRNVSTVLTAMPTRARISADGSSDSRCVAKRFYHYRKVREWHGITRIISADAHTLEPPDMWERYLPSQFHKDHLPKVVKDDYGGDSWLVPGGQPSPVGLVATGGQRYEEFRWSGGTYETMAPGTYGGKARLMEMDFDGVDAEVLFPSNSPKTISYFANHPDPEVHEAGIEAYNRWMLEDYAAADPERLIATAMIPQRGIDRAVEALHEAKASGFRTINSETFPSGGAKLSRDDDPFWAAAEELGIPINLHLMVQPSYRNLPQEVQAKIPNPFAQSEAPGPYLHGRCGSSVFWDDRGVHLSGMFSTGSRD